MDRGKPQDQIEPGSWFVHNKFFDAYDRETKTFRYKKYWILYSVIIHLIVCMFSTKYMYVQNILVCFLVFFSMHMYCICLLNFSLLCSSMSYMEVCILSFHLEHKNFFILSYIPHHSFWLYNIQMVVKIIRQIVYFQSEILVYMQVIYMNTFLIFFFGLVLRKLNSK